MSREATAAEKAVFGANVEIDPDTDLPIETGIGAATTVERNAMREAQAKHSAEFERLQAAEKTLTAELADAREVLAGMDKKTDALTKRAESAEASEKAAVAELAEAQKHLADLTAPAPSKDTH